MTREWYQGLLSKLPEFNPAWPPDVESRSGFALAAGWWECFAAMQQIARKLDAQGAVPAGPVGLKNEALTRSQAMKDAWARRRARELGLDCGPA